MLGTPRAQRRPGLDVQTIGFVDEDVAAFARAQGAEPVRVLGLPEKRLVHADRPVHEAGGIALSQEEYRRLPEVIARPDAIYWDRDHATLVYTRTTDDGRVIFVPVAPGYMAKGRGRLDAMVNAYKITPERLADRARFARLEGGAP